jgi:hypothetical protein
MAELFHNDVALIELTKYPCKDCTIGDALTFHYFLFWFTTLNIVTLIVKHDLE